MIHTIIQGKTPETDLHLYYILGPLLIDADIHAQLGMPITSKPGDTWYIETDKNITYRAFALLRHLKNGKTAHIRYLHGHTTPPQKKLIERIIRDAQEHGLTALHTNDKTTHPLWARYGFIPQPTKRRGHYVRWLKTLEAPKP